MAQRDNPVVVGIGASAGGVKALQNFFEALGDRPNAAFVVVIHLDPQYKSQLAEIVGAHTAMPVEQVSESAALESNHVYVISPNRRLMIADHVITATPFEESSEPRAPIDTFFRSLAERNDDGFAYGIVLTGAGSDGANGVKFIKGSGGIVLVQDPHEAEFPSMPRAAIATGVADLVLPIRELANHLVELLKHTTKAQGLPAAEEDKEEVIRRILAHLRVRTGHDFSLYKRATILRRLARRVLISRKESLEGYYEYLRENAEEAKALFADFLISVTTFFRDPKAFGVLARDVVPKLFDEKSSGDTVRVWVPGCATGEEAYTIGMMLLEEAAHRDVPPEIQVFASDLDTNALAIGREGRFPATIEADVSEERISRFFVREGEFYRVRRELRDIILFASHSLLRDPPFSRVDMISCRNLLIYLNRELQNQACSTFHYALKPGGFLFLGTSESVDHPSGLFRVVNREARIFQSVPSSSEQGMSLPVILSPRRLPVEWSAEPPVSPRADTDRAALHRHMLEKVAPPSMLIDEHHHAIHLSDSAGRYLKFSGGSITTDATELVREELRFGLRMALHRAFGRGETTLSTPILVQFNGDKRRVYLQVKPALEENDSTHYALVLFIEGETVEPKESAADEGEPAAQVTDTIKQLQDELQLAHGQLRATREDSEAANEELRAANEELQSINEEYRSTSEELETSKEELQSINEELQTVNSELKFKLESVSRTNSDLQNLMAASDFGTLFLDTALRIKRFTPKLTELFNITPNDEGRPITDFTHQLEYDGLAIHARAVLKNLVPVEHEVKSHDGRWYLVRVRPYRTVDDKIDGVVATFVDITVRRRTEEALRASEERFRALVIASSQVIYSMSPDWKEMRQLHGRGFLADLGSASHEWLGKYILVEDQPRFVAAMSEAIRTKSIFELEHRVRRADGSVGWITSRAVPILNEDGEIVEWFGAATDITYRKSSEEALIQADRLKDEFLATLAHELRNPLAPIHNAAHVLKKRHGVGDPDAPLLDTIQRQVEHLVRLVSELTEVSRISRGKIDLRKEGIDVANVVRDAVETSKPLAEKKGHRITTSLPKEPLWVFGDRMRLVQVVANLINNATKYTAANGAIEIKAGREDRDAVLRVRDNGIGVSADMLPHVFELFTQIGSSADSSEGGLGIGLALARKLVELHGGRITAHSEGQGRGSEFVVRLPLYDEPPSSETAAPATEDNHNSVRVLVVDDQREVGNSMGLLLDSMGAVVRVVYDGPTAVAMVDEFKPDIIFLDIGMPGVDGYETARILRGAVHEHPFLLVALTGWGQSDDLRRAQEAGFDEHLTKPASLSAIEKLLRRAASA